MPKFEREVEIDASVEKVWEMLTNPKRWPEWFPGVDSVAPVTSISEGESFEWTKDGQAGKGTVVKMEPMKYLKILTQLGDDKDSHEFELKPSGGFMGLKADECKIQYTLDTLMGGGILGSFVAGGNPKDALRVKKSMTSLRKIIESL